MASSESRGTPRETPRGRGTAANPPNRFDTIWFVADEEARTEDDPAPRTHFLKDPAKSIIAYNESPDVGFDASINPYRGCEHGCVYCLCGKTPILMADGTHRRLADLRVGDEIYGTLRRGWYRRLVKTTVLAHWQTRKPAYRVTLGDGTTLTASGDHRFLTSRGWKFVTENNPGEQQRAHLTTNDKLMGTGPVAAQPAKSREHRSGYLSGMNLGDGLLASYEYARPGRVSRKQNQFRLALADDQALDLKSSADLSVRGIESLGKKTRMFDITTGTGDFIANGVVSHNCYARPTHEYLGFSSGLDFETKILVKEDAPKLLRRELTAKRWKPQPIALSGNTDSYQPGERRFELTRGCLEVLAELRNPVVVITKNHLVTRDIDHLKTLAAFHAVTVCISVTTLDGDLARVMEPRTSHPRRRLEAIRTLSSAGIPTGVLVAPIIPGLTDSEIPAILNAAAEAGATFAGWVMLRLPHGVEELFDGWLAERFPDRRKKIQSRIRAIRGGRMNDPNFTTRMRGEGIFAEQIAALFDVSRKKAGIPSERPELSTASFRRGEFRQGELFAGN